MKVKATKLLVLLLLVFMPAHAFSSSQYKILINDNAVHVKFDKVLKVKGLYVPDEVESAAEDYANNNLFTKELDFKNLNLENGLYDSFILTNSSHSHEFFSKVFIENGLAVYYELGFMPNARNKLYVYEHRAINNKVGMWSENSEVFLSSIDLENNISDSLNKFRIVKGLVKDAKLIKNNFYINFGSDWRTDFTVKIAKTNLKKFDDIDNIIGKEIIVKGWVEQYNGPMIEVYNQGHIIIM